MVETATSMAWCIGTPDGPKPKAAISKLAMRMLDRAREAQGVRWKETLMIAGELCGKTKGLSLGECKRVLEEIKRRQNGNK